MSNPKLATLIDPFNEGSINTSVWNATSAGAASLDTVNSVVSLAVGTTASTYYSLGAAGPYDATSSSLYAQIVAAPVGNGGTSTILKLASGTNGIQAILSTGGGFEVQVITAGSYVNTSLPTYSPDAHRWWRFTENGSSQFLFSTSPDGFNWTTLATLSYTWSATAVSVFFQTGATDTEPAGQVATISSVNTMLGGVWNPNWPRLEDAWGSQWNCNGGDLPLDRYTDLTIRTQGQSSAQRGKQYEMDQIQSGTASASLKNTDGVLDPLNSAGPYYGHIQPYQPWRRRMMWPRSRNVLSQVMATGGDLGGQPLGTINSGNNGPDIFSATDTTGGSFVSSASAWQGNVCMQFAVPASAPYAICYTPQPAVSVGSTWSQQIQVRNITPSTSMQVAATIWWLDVNQNTLLHSYGTTTTLTGSATAGWTQLTVTGTAPAGTAFVYFGVLPISVPAATTVQVDGWQAEAAAAPSAWCCPGSWYGVFGGFTENWESSWGMGGTYGVVNPTGVDAMGLLSQVTLTDPLTQEITNNSPRFLYMLADPEGSANAADWTGNYASAPLTNSKYGPGSFTFGASITASNPTTGIYTGSTGTVAALANPNPGQNVNNDASTYLSLNSVGIAGPANVTTAWTRMCAWRYTAGSNPTSAAYFWSSMDKQRGSGYPGGSTMYWVISNSGQFFFSMGGPASGGVSTSFAPGPTTAADGNWHLAIVSYNGSTQQLIINLDGTNTTWPSVYGATMPTGLASDNFGAYVDIPGGGYSSENFEGNLSYCAEFPTALSTTAMTTLYSAWKSAFAGESSTARYSRILRYAGYTGVTNLQTGLTQDMGPATDISGLDGLSALQTVVDSENGQHFVDRFGTVNFQARSARYNAITPMYIFGENTAAGEWPYENVVMPLDPTHIGNLVQVTQYDSNQVFTAVDATSQTDYFPRTLQRTINVTSTLECQSAAQYLLSRYKQPAVRISSIVLHPSAVPAMWPVCLSLELGMRITVNRRPPAAPMISVPCFIENISWSWDDTGEATVTLQCSPVDPTPYGIFASFHTTLASSIASNSGSITINAGADNTNPAAAQISSGQQLVLSLGTANQETVTVNKVAATSSGWSTCVITLQANTTHAHTSGDVVCEPLPSNVTSASTYDSSSVIGSVALSY